MATYFFAGRCYASLHISPNSGNFVKSFFCISEIYSHIAFIFLKTAESLFCTVNFLPNTAIIFSGTAEIFSVTNKIFSATTDFFLHFIGKLSRMKALFFRPESSLYVPDKKNLLLAILLSGVDNILLVMEKIFWIMEEIYSRLDKKYRVSERIFCLSDNIFSVSHLKEKGQEWR